jgi:hypothetical protein
MRLVAGLLSALWDSAEGESVTDLTSLLPPESSSLSLATFLFAPLTKPYIVAHKRRFGVRFRFTIRNYKKSSKAILGLSFWGLACRK